MKNKKIVLNLTDSEYQVLICSLIHYKNITSPYCLRNTATMVSIRKSSNSLYRKIVRAFQKDYYGG